jgi:hypothetical protein
VPVRTLTAAISVRVGRHRACDIGMAHERARTLADATTLRNKPFSPEGAPHLRANGDDREYQELYWEVATRLHPACGHMSRLDFDQVVHDICIVQLKWQREGDARFTHLNAVRAD